MAANNAPLGDLPLGEEGFVDTCWGSKQTNVAEDALWLRLFPFSLRRKALDWLKRLPNHSITTWDELADMFTTKFFSPGHMAALRDEILAFKQEPNEPLHKIWVRYRTMVKECPNNDMTEAMIQQTFYRGINTTNQYVVNQLVGGNFMKLPYDEACDILNEIANTSFAWQSRVTVPQGDPTVIHLHKELHDHGQAIAKLTTTMNQLAKAQLQQVQNPRQVNAMESVNMLVNKRRQRGQKNKGSSDHYDQDSGGFQDDGVIGVATTTTGVETTIRVVGTMETKEIGGKAFKGPPMYEQPNNPPLFPFQGPSSSNNEMGRIEIMFEQIMKKNADSDSHLASHNTSIRNLEVQLGQISQSLNNRPKGVLPSDTVVNPNGGNNSRHVMVVTIRKGRGGDVNASKQKEILSDEVELQKDEIPLVVKNVIDENVTKEVSIDIQDAEVETQNDVNPSREYVIDMSETVVPKAKAPLPRPPPPYPQRLAKKKNEN
ncbi:uncharacterized protein [Nicotiana sylvestris]|uniref:uncharacterized protein n=1 Tax=Nicotiana sylvestris TaxID=4096 RepID=UPI00388C3EDF